MPDEPTQKTPEGKERERMGLPGEGGYEIPVPKRGEIEDALAKVAKPQASTRKGRRRPKK